MSISISQSESGEVTINVDGTPYSLSADGFKSMIADFGTFFRELSSPTSSLTQRCAFDTFLGGTPKDSEGNDVWSKTWQRLCPAWIRWQVYDWAAEQGLLDIVRVKETDCDVAAITKKWVAQIGIPDATVGWRAFQNFDAILAEANFAKMTPEGRKALAKSISASCLTKTMANPTCNWIQNRAMDFGVLPFVSSEGPNGSVVVSNKQAQCKKCCAFYSLCFESGQWVHSLMKLKAMLYSESVTAEELSEVRDELTAMAATRDSVIGKALGVS